MFHPIKTSFQNTRVWAVTCTDKNMSCWLLKLISAHPYWYKPVLWAVCFIWHSKHHFFEPPCPPFTNKSKMTPHLTFCQVKVPIEQIQMWTSLRSFFLSLSLSIFSHFLQQAPQPLPPPCKQCVFPFPFLVKKSQTGAGRHFTIADKRAHLAACVGVFHQGDETVNSA